MHGAFAPDGVFVLFDLPKEQTVYAYPSRAFGWLGMVSQGFRLELMTKDSSGAKQFASEAVLPHAHRVALSAFAFICVHSRFKITQSTPEVCRHRLRESARRPSMTLGKADWGVRH